MLTIVSYLLFLLGTFLFSFVLWKKLRDDYTNQQIYSYTLFSVISALLGLWAANSWSPEFAFLVTFGAFALSSFLLLKYLGIKFFEFIDAVSISFLYFYFFFRTGLLLQLIELDGFNISNPAIQINIAEIVLIIIAAYLYKFFLKRYRQFSWYPSGKIGFAGLATSGLFFLFQIPIESYDHLRNPLLVVNLPYIPVTMQMIQAVISLLVFITFAFVIYLRSGRR